MKIAYLVICHKNPEQVNNLINKLLQDKDAFVFIHIDKKSNIANDIQNRDRLYIMQNRINCLWGRVNQVEIMFKLLEFAYSINPNFDYYNFMSGDSYPIKSYEKIHDILEKNNGYSFITIGKEHGKNSRYYYRTTLYYSEFYLNHIVNANFLVKVVKKIEFLAKKLIKNKLQKEEIDYYFGSNWSTLHKDFVNYVLNEFDFNTFLNKHRKSICFDECAFQTIIMNSSFKNKIINKNLMFVDFNNGINATQLRYDDVLNLPDYMWARKFVYPIDGKIELLSEEL